MKNSNQIEDIFQKLENGVSGDLSGKESVWEKVEQKLDKKEEKWKIIPFPVWKLSGIAASVLLMVGVGYFLLKDKNETSIMDHTLPPIVNVDNSDSKNNSLKDVQDFENEIVSESNETQIVKNYVTKTENDLKNNESNQRIVHAAQTTVGEGVIVGYRVKKMNDGEEVSQQTIALNETVVTGYLKPETYKMQAGVTVVKSEDLEGKSINGRKKIKGKNPKNEIAYIKGADYTTDAYLIEKKSNQSVDQMLAGKVAGLHSVAQNGGAPGSVGNVVIRGAIGLNGKAKEPLYVVDGIYMSGNDVNAINPEMIQNIEVLKDASQLSVYGSRGANGVVIIKTKNGVSKKELRRIKRQNRKNKSNNQETSFVVPQLVEVSNEEYSSFVENKFENPAVNPLSTFSVDVDKAAYSNIRRMLNNGQTVPKDAVRIEEMINYFNYNYPQPTGKHPFSINTEYSDAPWNPGHKLLKIGLQGKNLATENLPNSNLVFLIDVSGSMNDSNKLPLLKKSLELLVNNLRENDKVSIVVYAGAAGVVLEPTSGANKTAILEALDRLSAGGSTAGAAGIELAYQLAQENFIKDGNNRVILATDGDFNVGTSAVKDLETLIEEKRKTGIFLTCLGYGMGNYKDNRMETLANKGNGNYAYIDNLQEANKFLVQEFSGTLYTIAKDVKIQIEFNPQLVQSYRLIGYETRLLEDEDFANDAIDAGEIGAGHQVTALYEIIPVGVASNFTEKVQDLKYSTYKSNNSYQNELATIKFRYKQPDGDKSTEIVQPIQNNSIPIKNASDDFKFAADVAWFGLKLRDSEYIEIKDTEKIMDLGKSSMKNDEQGFKSEFIRLVELVK